MKITQIATALNNVINKLQIGATVEDSAIVAVDDALSNIVDVGKTVLDYTGQSNENYDSFIRSLIDQVGKVIFVDRTYTSQAPNILKEGWEYGSILQKVRCELQSARDNATWDLFNYPVNGGASYPDPFELSPPNVSATFYNSKVTYEVPITLADYQLREAFRGASEMSRFFSMIENRIRMKRTLCNDGLIMQTIAHLIASKIAGGNTKSVINLLALYNAGVETPITASAAMRNPDFLRFASNTIMKYKKYIAAASDQYNEGDYITFTTPERLKFIAVTDFAKDMETYLYSGAYHDEFVRMEGYEEVAFWQDASNRTKIDSFIEVNNNPYRVTNDYVVAVMFDDEAAAVCNENDRVTSIYNPRGEYTNYFYKWDALYMNDLFENCIVFTLSDEGIEIPDSEITIAKNGTKGTDVTVDWTPGSGATALTAYAKLDNSDLTVGMGVGDAFDTTGWDALTDGTAKTYANATAGQYVNIVKVQSSKVYQVYSYKLTVEDIK